MVDEPKATKRPRRARGSLSEAEILEGAYRLVEQGGLRALSMPALARELKAGVTSIYWYFRSKDELLLALAERVTEEMYSRLPPTGDDSWEIELERYFVTFRRELLRTPIYLELFSVRPAFLFSRPTILAMVTKRLETELTEFVRAGLSPEQAAFFYNACSIYTRGFVVFEQGVAMEAREADHSMVDDVRTALVGLDPERYPILSLLPDRFAAGALSEEQFLFGLRLLLGGIPSALGPEEGRVAARPT
jgi:AcrR family transcriptional regulator